MKNEEAWRSIGQALVIGNWLICFELKGTLGSLFRSIEIIQPGLLSFTPALLLTLAWRGWLKNPALMKRAVMGTALATVMGLLIVHTIPEASHRFQAPTVWPWVFIPLIYFGVSVRVLLKTQVKAAELSPAPEGDRIDPQWLIYLISGNFILLTFLTLRDPWILAAIAAFAATLAAWRFSPGRPILALGLAATQTASLAASLYAQDTFGSKPALLFQIGVSSAGLLLSILAALAARIFSRRPSRKTIPIRPGPVGWALWAVGGILLGLCGPVGLYKYLMPDHLPSTAYNGPMKTHQIGWLQLELPEGITAPWLLISAVWPEGEVLLYEAAFDDGGPPAEQFEAQVNRALDTRSRELIRAKARESIRESRNSSDLKQPPLKTRKETSPNEQKAPLANTRSARIVDRHFQAPARLISGGALSKIEILVQTPGGYLKFGYDPQKQNRRGQGLAGTESEAEAWLLNRARELWNVYTWSGPRPGTGRGFKTAHGFLNPEPGAGFRLDFRAMCSDSKRGFYLTMYKDRYSRVMMDWLDPDRANKNDG